MWFRPCELHSSSRNLFVNLILSSSLLAFIPSLKGFDAYVQQCVFEIIVRHWLLVVIFWKEKWGAATQFRAKYSQYIRI